MVVLVLVVGILVLFVVLPFVLAFICGVYDGIKETTIYKKYFGAEDEKQ